MPMEYGNLYLIPAVIADNTQQDVIPAQVRQVLKGITYFLAEDVRTARRYLSSLKVYEAIEPLQFEVLNKDTLPGAVKALFKPVFEGNHLGVLSESGCPGIADPGALAVKFAHENSIRVIPLVGPSSLLLALMASGLNGQHFAFHGYLPIDPKEGTRVIKDLEKESRLKNQTQLFIETPYRGHALFQLLMKTLNDETLLCAAVNVTAASEDIRTLPVKQWKKVKKEIPKVPSVFLFLAI